MHSEEHISRFPTARSLLGRVILHKYCNLPLFLELEYLFFPLGQWGAGHACLTSTKVTSKYLTFLSNIYVKINEKIKLLKCIVCYGKVPCI